MKQIHRAYKFRLKPNKVQEELLNKHFGCSRFVFNHFLNERREQYQENKKSDNYYVQAKTLTELKKREETKWLKEVNAQSLQFALRCLDTSYLNFFRKKSRFPKFKSKKIKNSFTVPQKVSLKNNKLFIPKFQEGIKLINHRKVKGKIGKCIISKNPSGKFYASIHTEQEYLPSQKTGAVCGIDLGIKDFAITSDGEKFKNPKYLKKYEQKLTNAQRHLSRKKPSSNSFEKQKWKVAKIHEKISNARKDNLHKISKKLIEDYDLICLENLDVKKMMSDHKFSKHITDASWSSFIQYLEYKADWNDKTIVKIDRYYPSSKTCSVCGWIHQGLKLSDRFWVCKNCNTKLDRDLNASKNILKEGLKSVGATDYTDGVGKENLFSKPTMKSETYEFFIH